MTDPERPIRPTEPLDAADPDAGDPDDPKRGTRERSQPGDHDVDRLFEEGAGAPDAADIEDPATQR